MSFQIIEVVLYGYEGDIRRLPFQLGRLNVITGASKTGKTALIPIIDYCLGAGKCSIPFGVIRTKVMWVGLRLSVDGGQVFIARRLPETGKETSSEIFYLVGKEIDLPKLGDLHQTINISGLEEILTAHAGIGENVHNVPAGQTRHPLSATIRHALLYCFQHQTEIDSNRHLFHLQSEEWMPQAIKDTLPYFLGAVDDDHVFKMGEVRRLRHELRIVERKYAEYERIQGKGISRAESLLSEAADLGLNLGEAIPDNWIDCVAALREIITAPPALAEYETNAEGDEFDRLQMIRQKMTTELQTAREQLTAGRLLSSDRDGYTREAEAQSARLKSIELFDPMQATHTCPLCSSELHGQHSPPHVQEIKDSLITLDAQIRAVAEHSPQMQRVLRTLEERILSIQGQLRENRERLEAIQLLSQRLQAYKDRNARVGHMYGRISLYLESVPQIGDSSNLSQEISRLKENIALLEVVLTDEAVADRLVSVLSVLTQSMGSLAKYLELEHSEFPLRLDLRRLTIVADSTDGPIPMEVMGSGENWVGYHLVAHFALHEWFIHKRRPVPRFLFIDQPSQVYFPEDGDWEDRKDEKAGDDRQAVSRMYKLALNVVNSMHGDLQIIVTDHANINETWFQDCIVERWRDGDALVPLEWGKSAQ